MNYLSKLLASVVLVIAGVVGFFLFATVGLAVLLVVLGLLFFGALSMRGKRGEQSSSSSTFRVITFGIPGEQKPGQQPGPDRFAGQANGQESKTIDADFVELSPDDYRRTDADEENRKPK